MQTPSGWSRAELAAAIRSPDRGPDRYWLEVSADGESWEDVTEDLVAAGQVAYSADGTLHRTASLTLSKELLWGIDRVRVRCRVTAPEGTFEVPVFTGITSTPTRQADAVPPVWEVECYDLLWLLDDIYGRTFIVEQDEGVLAAVRGLVEDAGLTLILSAEGDGERILEDPKVFSMDEELTRLAIVNRLLRSVGYRDLWVDGAGRARSEPSVGLAGRGAEWVYDASQPGTEVAVGATAETDLFGRVNRLLARSDDPEAGLDVVELEVADGYPVRTALENFEAVDEAALITQADAKFEELRQVTEAVSLEVAPNPLHSHRDVVHVAHPDIGVDGRGLVAGWTLPLDGSRMPLTVERVVEGVGGGDDPDPPDGVVQAVGGDVTEDGTWRYHTFTSDGTFEVLGAPDGAQVEVFLVGGGGGSRSGGSSGGGGGGRTATVWLPISVSSYPVSVGAGGAAETDGSPSLFAAAAAAGGDGSDGRDGGAGGSGGGGGRGTSSLDSGGDGGSDGSDGSDGSGSPTGVGGPGQGTTTRAFGDGQLYAGGGGGAGGSSGSDGAGGAGGGGAAGEDGAANTGGGAGGDGRTGGSGIVLVRYPL